MTDRLYRAMTVLAILPWIVLALAALKAPPPVSIALSPRVGFGPLTVKVSVHVEPHPRNRIVEWVIEGDTGFRSSRSYDAQSQPLPTYQMELRNVPPGHYMAVAFLTDDHAITVQSGVAEACFSGNGLSCSDE